MMTILTLQIDSLNRFLKESKKDETFSHRTNLDIQQVDKSRRNKILNFITAVILATLALFTSCFENQLSIWTSLLEKRKVEKKLGDHLAIPGDVLEIMKAYNAIGSMKERRRLISILTQRYDYAFLRKFNPQKPKLRLQQDDNSSSGESDDDDDFHPELVWKPSLSRHVYHRARLHYLKFGYGLAMNFREARVVNR